jgi:hypothetical protein
MQVRSAEKEVYRLGGRRETKKQRPFCNEMDKAAEQTTEYGIEN